MTGPAVRDYEDDVCDPDLPTRIDAVECSLEAAHEKLDIILAAIDDRDKQHEPTPSESNKD